MNRNAESLRRLGDLHEAWVFRCPKGRTPPGCTTPRQWGRTPPDAARHSAPEGRAGGQLEDPRAAGDSELHFIQVSSCSATVCHGGPGCSAHPVRRNAMTHLHFPGPAGEKNAGHSQQTLFWFKLTRKCQCFPKLSQCMTPTHRSLPHQLSPARDQQQWSTTRHHHEQQHTWHWCQLHSDRQPQREEAHTDTQISISGAHTAPHHPQHN